MAALSKRILAPRSAISERVIPSALREALHFIFQNVSAGVWFVGGSAIAGYYAEHRRSDDIDLFVADTEAYQSAVRAVKALANRGALLTHESTSPIFYRTNVQWMNHGFTIAVVIDENIHRVGHAEMTHDGVRVADIETLLAMKIACLVSRCSEKDLFDLAWFFEHVKFPSVEEMVTLGQRIDGGVTSETLLIGLRGTTLRKEACGFVLASSRVTMEQAYKNIIALQKKLLRLLVIAERQRPLSPDAKALARAARQLKKWQ